MPEVEAKFKKIDARAKLRLEQRTSLTKKIQNMLIVPRPEYLATADERMASDRIAALEQYMADHPGKVNDDLANRIKRLRGVLLWRVHSEYNQRLTDAYNHQVALDDMIEAFKIRYYSFIRTRQAATQSYEGYQAPIRKLRTGLFAAQRKLKGVMARQGRLLETMAINELDIRRKRLEDYQIKARFALAESYDRASKAELEKQIEDQNRLSKENLKRPESEKETQKQQESTPPPEDGVTGSDSSIPDKFPDS